MTFMQRSAKRFLTIKAAKEFRKEIEKAGVDNLKILADNGISVIETYLKGCSAEEKATYRRNLNALLQMGITGDMLLEEVARQLPELVPEIEGRESYKQSEIKKLESFIGGQ